MQYQIIKPLRETSGEVFGNISYGNLMKYKDEQGRIEIKIGDYSEIFDVRNLLKTAPSHYEVHNFPNNPMKMFLIRIEKKSEEEKRIEREKRDRQILMEALL